MENDLLKNGKLIIPLYHGTSSFFLPSICENGLGGINPIEQTNARAFFEEIFKLCDVALAGDEDWEACKFAPELLRDQENNGDSANYQHGDTYLSPSRASAVGYALTNRYGSELISNAHRLFSLVQDRQPKLLGCSELVHHPLMNIFNYDHKPIILKICNMPISILASESGGSPEKTLDSLQIFLPFVNLTRMVFNSNFRLLHPVPYTECEVEYIDPAIETNPFAW